MKPRPFQVPRLALLVSAAEILQRTMETRGPGPGSAMACKLTGFDVPDICRIAHGLALECERWADNGAGTVKSLNMAAFMGAATKAFTRLGDFQPGSEMWDNQHYRDHIFRLCTSAAGAMQTRLDALTETEQVRRNLDN